MKAWQAIRTGVGASVLAHLFVLALVVFLAEVHPFGAVTAEPIAVDIVTPEEVPTPDFRIPDPLFAKSESASSKAAAKESLPKDSAKEVPTPAQQPQQAQSSQREAPQKEASQKQAAQKTAEPKQAALAPAQQIAPPQPSPSPVVVPAPIPQAPDISEKYHVMLGLPQNAPENVFDELASTKADLGKNIIAEFRRHLKSCSKLPSSISPTDTVTVTLRVFMEPDGKLSTDPMLVAGTGSAKGPILMQSVIQALQACQPYDMLPADRYAEWKVLDLSFTPQDF